MELPVLINGKNHREYQTVKVIGCWGCSNPQSSVYLAATKKEEVIEYVVLKLADKLKDGEMYEMGLDEKVRSERFDDHSSILNISDHFFNLADRNTLCLVLPSDTEVSTVRSLMRSSPEYRSIGLPEECIAIAVRQTLIGLSDIHGAGDFHRQISAGNILFDRSDDSIKLAFAASIYKRAGFQGLDWAVKAPEVVYSAKTDVWLIGIAALEMGYGETTVASGKELLAITGYISKNRQLPNTWEELRMEAQKLWNNGGEEQIFRKKLIKKKKRGDREEYSRAPFSKSFVNMVAICLAEYEEDRPTADKLLQHDFFKNRKGVEYFKDMVV